MEKISIRNRVSFLSTLLSAYYLLLYKYTANSDLIVGTMFAGRDLPAFDDVVGLFVNTVALRVSTPGDLALKDFIKQVNKKILDAYKYQYYPMEKVAQIVDSEQRGSNISVFQTIFQMARGGKSNCNFIGLKEEKPGEEILISGYSAYELSISIVNNDTDLDLVIDYRSDLFKKETIERFFYHYERILDILITSSEIFISEMDVLAEEEKQQILYDFNNTGTNYPAEKKLHQLFDGQAVRAGDKIALVGMGMGMGMDMGMDMGHLTYRELNKKSDGLAQDLNAKGVGPDTIVAIMMPRSFELIIGILGILKAGGAYLPVDPDYPQERKDYMVKDSNAKLILGDNCQLSMVNSQWSMGVPRASLHYSNQLAYIIYTSGSTGKPKGAALEHRNLVNLLIWGFRHTNLDFSCVLQFASISFDASFHEIFSALLFGGRLCLIANEIRTDIPRLFHVIETNIIRTVFLPISFLKIIFNESHYIGIFPRCIRHIQTAGEQVVISERFAGYLKQHGVYLHNHYGPSETHVVTALTLEPSGEIPQLPSIGKPVANTMIYILDRHMNIQPVGVSGELYIAGIQVGRGYLNNPELTAERFKFNRTYKANMTYILYKTGDLARWLPDGNIEFLGRIDQQVKIRGFRVELGEIESRLLTYPGIKEVVVLAHPGISGDKYLCAYIVPGKELDISELKDYLAKFLPDYLIPSYFEFLDKIELSPSGKINRNALSEPQLRKSKNYAAARDQMDTKLIHLWSEILGKDSLHKEQLKTSIGIDDNFFQAGGHSLKAMIFVARVHKELNVTLPLASIFKTPTIRGLSEYIKGMSHNKYEAIQPLEKKEYYILSSAQKRLYVLQQMELVNNAYNIPGIIPLQEKVDIEKFKEIFVKLIKRHDSLRTSFHIINDKPVQKIHDHREIDFKIENYENFHDPDFLKAFDLMNAPLIRVGFSRALEEKNYLMVNMHHIICDGISQEILKKDFESLYLGEGLPSLRLQYKDFAEWQQKDVEEKSKIEMQKAYWLNEFRGNIPVLNLPIDFPRPPVQTFTGDNIDFNLSADQNAVLNSLAYTSGTTIFIIITAIFNILLAKLSSQDDIIIGTPTAGRRHADLEKIIGMFVNTLALRNLLKDNSTFRDFLQEVNERTLQAFDNQEYPFEDLVENVIDVRDISRNPLFDVMYAHYNFDMNLNGKSKIEIAPSSSDSLYHHKREVVQDSKFDLTLSTMEQRDTLYGSFQYCTQLFKHETVERFIIYFKQIIYAISADPYIKIHEIEMISAAEKKQVLFIFNETRSEYPGHMTIPGLYGEQVARTPDRVAVIGSNSQICPACITYRQLDKQSTCLAALLIKKGVKTGDIAGIMMERSIEMIVGILAILKSGGAYLPIDPEYPQERINYMLKDSNAAILLTNEKKNNCQCSIVNCQLSMGMPRALHSCSNQLAYVIYTSGSTGKPKGVMIEHKSVVNFIMGITGVIPLAKHDRLLSLTTITFDIFGLEMFVPLMLGSSVIIGGKIEQMDTAAAGAVILKEMITTLQVTPSRLQLLLTDPSVPDKLSLLKYLLVGGEVFPASLLLKVKNIMKGKIYNLYGPTETTIWSTLKDVTGANSLTIGKPIANTHIYILDKYYHVKPIGVAGDLYIAGDGVAWGYLNQPGLTAERFIFNRSYRSNMTYILYKTGDLARWLPDGNIEFLGRIDNQVKIRGFRVELGEIEAKLLKYEGIKEAVAAVHQDRDGDKYICAYITGEISLNHDELRRFLSRQLPAYMIPANFVKLDKIPLTTHGKLDNHALIAGGFNPGKKYNPPRNKIDIKLATIWEHVLGIAKELISIDHDFFELGGHSFKAIQVISAANRENFNISLIDIFKYRTIAALADYIMARQMENQEDLIFHEEEEIACRQNPGFCPETYPENFPCMLGAIREKLKYEQQYDISKSIFVAGDGSILLELGYKENSDTKDKLRCLDYPFARELGKFKDIPGIIGYSTKIKRFSSLEEELKYCSSKLKNKEVVLLTGTTYFLNYSPDYLMPQTLWLKKMTELFSHYDSSRKMELIGHVFVLVDIIKDNYIIYDSIYDYYGRVPESDLHKAIIGNSAIECSKGHISYHSYPPYQVVELDVMPSFRKNDKELLLNTMRNFANVMLAAEVLKRTEKGETYEIFLGLAAIKALAGIIENSLAETDSQEDLYLYTTHVINSWKIKYIFLRNFILDFLKYFPLPDDISNRIDKTISQWHNLYEGIVAKKNYQKELKILFREIVKQLQKINEEQITLFSEIARV